MAGNTSFNTLASTTLQNYEPTLDDNLSNQVMLYYFLKEAGQVRTKTGRQFVEPLLYAENSTGASYTDYEALTITPSTGISAAVYDPKAYSITVAISGMEEAQNAGPEQLIDLLEAKIKQAEISAIDDVDAMFWSDGSGNSGKDFVGLGALIGDATTDAATITAGGVAPGGIPTTSSQNTWWLSSITRSTGTLTLAKMSTAWNNATRGQDMPTWGATTQTLFEKYESLLQPQQRFTDSKTAEAGFQNLTFKGKPLVWGAHVPSGTVTFVNPKYIRLNKLGDQWMKSTPFVRPRDYDARYSQIISYGNLSCSNRKLAGSRLEGATA
jgi:hypothetical protein